MADSAGSTGPVTVPKLIKDIDTGSATLSVNGIKLTRTVGSMDLSGFFDAQGRPIGDWVEIEVLNRGRELCDSSIFIEDAREDSSSECDTNSQHRGQRTGSSTTANEGDPNILQYSEIEGIYASLLPITQELAMFEHLSDEDSADPIEPRKLRVLSAPKSTLNPLLRDTIPDGATFIRSGQQVPRGFIYRAPLIANMVYPPKLLKILGGFADEHPQDSLSLKSLLYAAQLWADIEEEPLLAEPNSKLKGVQFSKCSLEELLLGFEFWIRFHEGHQLLEFIHPFRFVRALFDSEKQKTGFLPRCYLYEAEIIGLLDQATTKWVEMGPEIRITIFPFSMPASNISCPSDLDPEFKHEEYMIALLNFDNIHSYGWPSFKQRGEKEIKVAMPHVVAETRLGAQRFPIFLSQAQLQAIYQPKSSGTEPLFGFMRSFGPIWEPIALPSLEPPKEQPAFTDNVCKLTNTPFEQDMSESTAGLIRQSIMAVFENLSQEGILRLKPNQRIEMRANLIPLMVNIPTTNFKRICAEPPMTIYSLPADEDEVQDAVITVSLTNLSNLVSKLDNHSAPLPAAWKDAHIRLRDLGKEGTLPNERTRSHARVLNIIKEARAKTNQDKAALVDLSESLKANPLAILEPAIKQVHVYVCRLVGIPATNESEWGDLEDQVSDVFMGMYAPVNLILKIIEKASKDHAKADGWGMKAETLLNDILNVLALEDLEALMKEEEESLEQAVKDIAAGTRSQSSRGTSPTA